MAAENSFAFSEYLAYYMRIKVYPMILCSPVTSMPRAVLTEEEPMNLENLFPALSSKEKRCPARLTEDIFILVCIFTLWPKILGWRGLFFDILLYIALIGLVIIFVRRIRRIRTESERRERERGHPQVPL